MKPVAEVLELLALENLGELDLRYLSPEEAGLLNRPVDSRSRLYSLGALLYERLTGVSPFQGSTQEELLQAMLRQSPRPLRLHSPNLPRALEALVLRLLEKDPDRRYQSVEAVREDLLALLERPDGDLTLGQGERRETLAAPDFVGREDELARLFEAEGLVVIEGSSGSGKSRLLQELALRKQAAGRRVLSWRARPESRYVPLECFRSLGAPEVADFGPEEFGRERTLRALGGWLSSLAPAVLVLDDCQWLDDLSLEVLGSVRQTTVVACFRNEERVVDWAPELRLELAGLGADEVERLARSMAGPLPERVLGELQRVSLGNPLVVVESLRELVQGSGLQATAAGWVEAAQSSTPRTGALLARRLQRLPEEAVRVLSVAAILGRRIDHDLLARVSGQDPGQALEAAEACQLIAQGEFCHDRIRELLEQRLDSEEKRELHRRAGGQLGEDRIFELAWHYEQAGSFEEAFPFAVRCAEQARRQHSLPLAEQYFRLALRARGDFELRDGLAEVLTLQGSEPKLREADELLQELLREAASDLQRAGLEARQTSLAYRLNQPERAFTIAMRALKRLGRAPSLWGTWRPRLPRGRPSLDSCPEDRLALNLFKHLVQICFELDEYPVRLKAHFCEKRLAEGYAPGPELAAVYAYHSGFCGELGWIQRGLRFARQSIEVLGLSYELGVQAIWLAACFLYSGEYDDCAQVLQNGYQALERAGNRWDGDMLQAGLGSVRYYQGRLPEAVGLCEAVVRHGGNPMARCRAAHYWARSVGAAMPLELLDELEGVAGSSFYCRGELLQARAFRLLDSAPLEAAGLFEQVLGKFVHGLTAMIPGSLAACYRLGGRHERAYFWARKAVKLAGKYAQAGPQAWREWALQCVRLGRPAEAAFERSLAEARRMGTRLEEAQSLWERSRVLGEPDWSLEGLRALGINWKVPGGPPAPPPPVHGLVMRFAALLEEAGRLSEQGLPVAEEALRRLLGAEEVRLVSQPVGEAPEGSSLAVAIPVKGEAYAWLEASHSQVRGLFGAQEQQLAELVGRLAGSALERHQAGQWVEAMFRSASVGLMLVDENGSVLECNPYVKEMLGFSGREFWEHLYGPDRGLEEGLFGELVAGSRDSYRVEVRHRRENGELAWVQVSCVRLEATRFVRSVSDISLRKLAQVVRFQTVERRLLALDLHDQVAQDMVALCQQLREGPLAELAGHGLEGVRDLMERLQDPGLDGIGLFRGLRRLGRHLERVYGVPIRFGLRGSARGVSALSSNFGYRIVQEALQNALRHSGSQRVVVRVRIEGGVLRGEVRDFGVGGARDVRTRHGVRGMRLRARLLGGRLRVLSDGGTRVIFRLPCQPDAERSWACPEP